MKKQLLQLPFLLLVLTGGCAAVPGAVSGGMTGADAWQSVIANLLPVRVDQGRERLSREYARMAWRQRLPERAAVLDRLPEDAAARTEARQALETAIGIAVQLLVPEDAVAAAVLRDRCREELGREFLVTAMLFPERAAAVADAAEAGVPDHLMARHRAGRDEAAMQLRILMGVPEDFVLPEEPFAGIEPVLPEEPDDLVIALQCRPELTGFTGSVTDLAAAVRYLESQMPPVSADADGAAASLRAALMILRLPDRMIRQELYELSSPEETRYLLVAWGIWRQLKLDRRALLAGDPGAVGQLRCDLGLEPGEPLPETVPEGPSGSRSSPAAELLLRLMAQ